ncbi:predicted protein [Naegleria gruberi]|uniref:Predicted protein n=1 Tax=Naegleria gruberi TaxID=5762 RepID=D2V3D6_NAEGR|nr:uncharacterized protein NAEGRDRAFT_63320 [Naegleria gruberi]EFC48753.1 predicted protein [Naegleria gruberi]|eukprot:XP_002681497.1 predicted protein [Naegleria gruberi strain NEG-M]
MPSEKKSRSSSSSKKSKSSKSSDESEDKKKKKDKKEKKEKRSSSSKKSRKSTSEEEPKIEEPKKVETTQENQIPTSQNYDLHKLNFIASRNINNHVYEKQLTELQFLINSKLIPTKQSLLSQLYKIQSKMTLVRKAKDKLCNEYKVQMDTLINNLNLQESNKMLVLKQDESSVLNQLNQIQIFSNKVGLELTQGRDDIPANAEYSTFSDISNLITESMFLSEKNLCLSIDNPSYMTTLLEYDQGDMKDLTFYKYK